MAASSSFRRLSTSRSLSRIVSDLLDLSRIEARRYSVNIESAALAPVVTRMLESLALKVADRELHIQVDVPGALRVQVDIKALEQVLQNLLDNAAKYTPEQGHINVLAIPHGEQVRLTVSNDGPPISPHQQARIFERFYRIDPGRSRDMGGTGLGLAIVKHLVEIMGGDVGVESGKGVGTTFWVHLPAD